ncbi:MAG: 4-hydroxy-tetrahydrodipicolinate reductase [Clostridia bacterium 41_269]|nr:MAG: 4-hydroxy-tetrahydrodipicolinate reductase [Clostridia bacterium 41_269]
MNNSKKIRVVVTGAAGRMGQAVMKGVYEDPDCSLVGAVDVTMIGTDVGKLISSENIGIKIERDLKQVIDETQPDVMVDFTNAEAAFENIMTALKSNVYPIVGTTGLSEKELEEIQNFCENTNIGAFFAPNFAIGAVLMMQCAKIAARFLPNVEIIELHHDKKLDSPSGTALRTAELIALERNSNPTKKEQKLIEKLEGCRGGDYEGIKIHSVRLPGLVAHQEVIFGGLGQTLSIRHDSISRESFIPGVLLAIKEAPKRKGVIIGLENLMDI